MATIDNYDMGVYIQYAKRTELIEQIGQEYHLGDAGSIPSQIQVLDLYPKPLEIDILLGVRIMQAPWALFFPPSQYAFQRRSPFGFFRIAPSLGSFDKEEEDERHLDGIDCQDDSEKTEKFVLKKCFAQIRSINEWLGFIIGRVGQFLQG